MKLLAKLQRTADFWFLLITTFIFFLLRFPSFFEPYWYGDEGVYEVLGFGIRHGRLLYQGIWDNKPPLLYLIYALFDGNQPYVRFFSFLVGLAAIYFFFALSKMLFEKKKSVFAATGFFALFLALPLIEGNIANAENFMVLPAVMSIYFIVRTVKEKKYSLPIIFLSGMLLGISFLIKVVAVFDFAAAFLFLGYIIFAWDKNTIKKLLFVLIKFSAGFFLPLLLTVGFFAYKGMLKTFIQSAFLSNVGYVNYGNQFIIPQGFLILKLLLLGIIAGIIFFKRKSLSLTEILIYLWVPFSLFSAFFSQRPYTHYMLVLLGSIALLTGIIFEKKWRIFHAILLVVIIVLLTRNFWFYSKTTGYYTNFVNYISGKKTITEYQSFFDKGVPRDYAIADFLKTSVAKGNKAFLWTNSAQVYYLIQQLPLGRYTVAYHMTATPATLSETSQILQKTNPKFIVIFPNASLFPFSVKNYVLRLSINGGLIYERNF